MFGNLHENFLVSFRMSNLSDTFGFEILYKLHHNEIQKKEDVIILVVHWYLVKYGLRCIGVGDSHVFDSSQKGSEILPKDWNTGPSYALRYVKNGALYLVCGIKSDDEILINFARLDNDTISNITFPIEQTVSVLHGSLETMIPSYETILHRLQSDFLKPICKFILTDLENTTETGTQTTTSSDSLLPRSERQTYDWNPQFQRPSDVDPGRVGNADLYPGGYGGGMIFDPFARRPHANPPDGLGVPGRLPPGAVPPGARFDPFGPRDLDPLRPHRRRPDDDHLPPPFFQGPGAGGMFI